MLPAPPRRRGLPWLPAALLLAGALALVPVAMAGTPSPAYPFKAKTAGLKTKDWAVQWWQWAYGIQDVSNPLFDDAGSDATLGQRGSVWFLCGAFNGPSSTRAVTIPAGKSLFFPVFSQEYDNVGAGSPATTDSLYASAAAFAAAVDLQAIFCTVDAIPVVDISKRRVITAPFDYAIGPGTPPTDFGGAAGDIAFPAVSDGYWVMLKPLAVGAHVVHFGGSVGTPYSFTQNVTYNITVVATQ